MAIERFREMDSEKHVLDLDNSEKLLSVWDLMLDQAYLGIVFEDPGGFIRLMYQLIHYRSKIMARRYTPVDSVVLITGETGTVQEWFAHAIHHAGNRIEGPFVCVNCASIPDELLESELFGYASGAFTGAQKKGKIGRIELSHGGTLFLDEIGELPFKAQTKLIITNILHDHGPLKKRRRKRPFSSLKCLPCAIVS
jgi:transcriptional regulator with AAA-type ATPase domain